MKKNLILFLTTLSAALFLQISNSYSASSEWQENQSKGAKTRLIASFYQNEKGEKKLISAIQFKIAPGWKIYGNDSGGIGLPPSIDFEGSTNLSKHEIFWPEATVEEEQIGEESIKYSTYRDELVLPIEIDIKDSAKPTELTANIAYGLCKDVCVPASEGFLLKVSDEPDEEVLQIIQKFFPHKKITDEAVKADFKPNNEGMNVPLVTISIILLAIIGGAILNIMPCVLPVLSIKLISVINHSNAPIQKVRFAFLSTIIGILFCFIVFAFCASLIKLTGNSLGWGLQFQNPYFLIFLTLVLVVFMGNLLGIFEINFDQVLATFLNKKITNNEQKERIFLTNFFSGILAVLLATPCSAPFLGTAISFALSQNFLVILLIFFSIGIGFALPYFVLLFAPSLVRLLPKPGMWMVKIKQLMAGLLAATILWLIYILSHNIGLLGAALIGILSIALLLSIKKIKSYFLKYLAIVLIVAVAFCIPVDIKKNNITLNENDVLWVEFDEAAIYKNIMAGRVVVVDVTADWCLSCKFNKIRVLQDKEVMAKLKVGGIIAIRGDITKPNEEIMNYLHKNGRFAIPFNAVYGPGAKNGILLSEFLTKKELLDAIEKAK